MSLILNQVLTANGTAIFDWRSHRGATPNMGTFAAYGTFGGGTVTLTVSFDGGVTYLPLQRIIGTAIIYTQDGYDNFQLMSSQNPIATEGIKIKATLTGATTPSITMRAYDML